MSIVNRVKNILLNPAKEWEVIAEEQATTTGLFTSYVLPLAAISAVIGIVSSLLFGAAMAALLGGAGAAAVSHVTTVIIGVSGFVLSMVLVYAMAYIVSALAGSFGGVSDPVQGAKLIFYSGTPVWVSGFLAIIPLIGGLLGLAGLGYACFLIAIGLKPIMGIPQEKTAGMTIVTLLVYFAGAVVIYLINLAIAVAGGVATGLAGA
jgi:hypothetical protein